MGGRGRQAGDIATRSHQTRDQSGADRVRRYREHDRNDGCRLLDRDRWESSRDYDIDLASDKLGRELGGSVAAAFRPAILNREVTALDPAKFAQPLQKSGDPWAPGRGRGRAQKAEGRQLSGLLRARLERPCCRAAEQRHKLASLHSIISSARPSRIGGTSKPKALAALRLITNSNLVPCWT